LDELWSDRLIEILIPNAPEFYFGQGLLYGDLQILDYDLGDMHTVTLKIKNILNFKKG
jgi:hypothetical protein